MLEAVLFDFDGTLCDSEDAWFRVLQREHIRLRLQFDSEAYNAAIGLPADTFDAFSALAVETDEAVCSVESRLEQDVVSTLRAAGPSRATRSIIEQAVDAGLRLAIATNSRANFVEQVLRGWDLIKYFEVVVGRSEGVPQKPDPAPYLRTLAALGLPPAAALAVEDSFAGAQSAIGAGLRCFQLSTTGARHNGAESIRSLDDSILRAALEER